MVFNTADDNWLASEVQKYSADIGMYFFAQRAIAQKRSAVFRRKDRVNYYFGEGLRHAHNVPRDADDATRSGLQF
jgi:hypothetical protein